MKVRTRWQNLPSCALISYFKFDKVSVPTPQAIYFEGDQGRDVRVAEIPESMADTANEHRAQVLLSIIVHRITARTQICR